MTCINSMAAELHAHELDIADELEKECQAKLDKQIHDMIHKERLTGVVLDMFENCTLEEPLVQCYLARTQEEKLAAFDNLVNIVETSLVVLAMQRQE